MQWRRPYPVACRRVAKKDSNCCCIRIIGTMRASAAGWQNSKGIFILLEAGKSATDFFRLMKRVIGRMHECSSLPCKQQQTRN